MKTKTIRAVLRKVFDDWVTSIDDPGVAELVKNNSIITGGCIPSMLLGEKVNDYDVYFTNRETTLAAAKYYVKRFLENPPPTFKRHGTEVPIFVNEKDTDRVKITVKSAGIAAEKESDDYQYFETLDSEQDLEAGEYVEKVMGQGDPDREEQEQDAKPKYRPVFLSSNAITLSNRIQLTIRFYGSPEEIHKNYDFVHCTNYWVAKSNELVVTKEALESLITKELRYQGSLYPLCSVIRTRKFLSRGWTINAGQYLKMALQISDLSLHDPEVLEDQLIGVDVAYFSELLRKVKEGAPEKLNTAYVVEIIDRMF